jgi:alpha-N-arabinofuranosidase
LVTVPAKSAVGAKGEGSASNSVGCCSRTATAGDRQKHRNVCRPHGRLLQRFYRASCVLVCGLAGLAHAEPVAFDWFEYTGRDAVFEQPLPPGHYRNPVLAGFYPDPSITRAGDRFYLVNSTFSYFPGIPVFESEDLVHWRQIGNVIDRPSQLDFDGLGVSRGVFAPTIEFHDGRFYVLNTAVDNGGNYFVTASDPAGPWSDPVWLPAVDGIDPSLFFDADGKVYLLNNGPPEGEPLYDGHRAIWIQEFDLPAGQPVGQRKVLINGGVDISTKPIWIEGPHIYSRDGWYYLVCAEGGTGPNHSQVALRGRSVWGPFEPFEGNPILTQRDLPPGRADPITNAGHADLVEAPDGSWWAIFLATRTYEDIHYNTGRETFLLPVTWRDGWPVILDQGKVIPYVARGPDFIDDKLRESEAGTPPLTGNFTWRDDFDSAELGPGWMQVRTPKEPWLDLRNRNGWMSITPRALSLDTLLNPSFLARRQQHFRFDASTSFEPPSTSGVAAGMAAFQSEQYWYFLGVRNTGDGLQLFLEKSVAGRVETVATAPLGETQRLSMKISGDAAKYSFNYAVDGKGFKPLRVDDDGTILSTAVAGGFVGAVVGLHARLEQDGADHATQTGGQ